MYIGDHLNPIYLCTYELIFPFRLIKSRGGVHICLDCRLKIVSYEHVFNNLRNDVTVVTSQCNNDLF